MVVGIALAIVGLTVLAVVRYMNAATIKWLPLTQLHDWQYSAPAGFDLDFLRAAIEKAQECLVHTGWSAQAIVDATSNVRVQVMPEKQWWAWGRTEAGEADVERGAIADRAAVARKLGLTRARVTQLLDLLLLAPDLQAAVLALEAVDGAEPMAERTLRAFAHAGTWAEQRAAWAKLVA